MSSKYYLTSRSPGVFFHGIHQGGWLASGIGKRIQGDRHWTWMLQTSKTDGGLNHVWSSLEDDDQDPFDAAFGRWLTPKLEAQSIGGTLDLAVGCRRSNLGATVKWRLYVYICVGDTNAVRHVLLDMVDTVDFPVFASPVVRALAAPAALTTGNALAGDRVVVELGVRCSPNPGPTDGITIFDTNFSIWFGTRSASDVAQADAVPGTGSPQNQASFINFSQTLFEQPPPVAPDNSTCAKAMLITSLPYRVVADTSVSADTEKSVWYKWTAPTTARVCISTFRSNYSVIPRIMRNGCAIQTGIIADGGDTTLGQWIYNSTHFQTWIAQVGVEYLFQFFADSGESNSARHGGGYLDCEIFYTSDLQPGDIILNAVHTAALRPTPPSMLRTVGDPIARLVALTDRFALFVPTGVSIDNTHRPILDKPTDTAHMDLRLAVTLFGNQANDLRVEFLDLKTLNMNTGSTAWMYMGLTNPGAETLAKNPASIVWDLEGNYYVGFFGDNYDHIGMTPTNPATAWIRKFRGNGVSTAEYPPMTPPPEQLAEYHVAFENSGSDYIDLSSDQRTLFYTSAGRSVKRFDTVTNTQLPDFAVVPPEAGPRPGLRGLRLLPPGDGTGGLVVADGINVKRLDGSGNVIRTYTPVETELAYDLDKVEVTGDLQYLWVSDQLSTTMFKFELGSAMARDAGVALGSVAMYMPVGQLCGFITYDGYRAGSSFEVVTTPPGGGDIPTPHVCECKSTPDSPNIGETPLPEPIVQFIEQCDGDGLVPSGELGTLGDDNWAL
jgi:hypothetical protein